MKKSVGLAILMVFLLLYPRFAAEGARYGLLLWYTSVVPSLFPFMVLSSLIVSSGGVSLLMKPVRAFLGPWLPLSENGCYTLISGLLCGCPMGGKDLRGFCPGGEAFRPGGPLPHDHMQSSKPHVPAGLCLPAF